MAGHDLTLALNLGSSSLKVALFTRRAPYKVILRGETYGIGEHDGTTAFRDGGGKETSREDHGLRLLPYAFRKLMEPILQKHGRSIRVVGHRIVHGGPHLQTHQVIGQTTLSQLRACRDLAPLHATRALQLYAEAVGVLPQAHHIACFDTAFHRDSRG